MQNNFMKVIQKFLGYFEGQKKTYTPFYKLIEIMQENDCYFVMIKVVNKNITFQARPEEILGNNALVDKFSPRDIRTLTYLGYLGINSPRYKILAQTLSTNTDKMIFSLKRRGENEVIKKTADEILNEDGIISHLNSNDAKIIGYTIATENMLQEKIQKEELLK